jgi:hypothetical protein
MTYRNRIKGLSSWVIDPEIKMPDSHSERKRGKSGRTNGKSCYLPWETFTSSGQPDRKPGNWWTTGVKESAEGIVDKDTSHRGSGGLTRYRRPESINKGSFEDA